MLASSMKRVAVLFFLLASAAAGIASAVNLRSAVASKLDNGSLSAVASEFDNGSFPIHELTLPQSVIDELLAAPEASDRGEITTAVLVPLLRERFSSASGSGDGFPVEVGDVSFKSSLGPRTVSNKCATKVQVKKIKATGGIENPVTLRWNKNESAFSWNNTRIFVDASVPAKMTVSAKVVVSNGRALGFGIKDHVDCVIYSSRISPVKAKTSIKAALGIAFNAVNATVAKDEATGELSLQFNLDIAVETAILDWTLNGVSASNCDIAGSKMYCNYLKKAIKSQVKKKLRRRTKAVAPKVANRVEEILKAKVGSLITIPIRAASSSAADAQDE